MKTISSLLLLSLSLVIGAGCAKTSSTAGMKRARTAEDYQARTLREIAANGMEAVTRGEAEGNAIVIGDLLPSRVTVTNTGNTRQMPAARKEVIRSWAARYAGSMEHYTLPYQTEYQFMENGAPYWIAVRTQSLPDFEQSFRNGDKIDLELIRLGGVNNGGRWEWVLLVENFNRRE